jgi:hypothetical protein
MPTRLLLVIFALSATPCLARRVPAPRVAPVESGGIRYVAPNTNGRVAYVEAWEIRTAKKLWTVTVFRNRVVPRLEEDVQWVFIKKLVVAKGRLVVTDERGRTHFVDLKQQAQKPNSVRLHEALTGVPFLPPGESLGIGWSTLGLPISAFEKLYLQDKRGLTRVKGQGDLVGHVCIDTVDKALRYVRLFTSPATVRTFDLPVWLEVVPASKVDRDFVYGKTGRLYGMGYVDALRRLPNMKSDVREFGVVSDREWRGFGLRLPTVTEVGADFVVTRGLVLITEKSPWGTGIVQQVAETVSSDGRISRRVLSKRKIPGLLVCLLPER